MSGNPRVVVRVEQEAIEAAQDLFPPTKGRSGGVALALRQLLYVALDQPIPKQFGEVRRLVEVDDLEEAARAAEAGDLVDVATHIQRVRDLLPNVEDPVDRLRLRAIVGRLVLSQPAS